MRKQITSTLTTAHIDAMARREPVMIPWAIDRSRTMAAYAFSPQSQAALFKAILGVTVVATRIH